MIHYEEYIEYYSTKHGLTKHVARLKADISFKYQETFEFIDEIQRSCYLFKRTLDHMVDVEEEKLKKQAEQRFDKKELQL